VTPYICVNNAAEAIKWYLKALPNAKEVYRFENPDGSIGHAEIQIGDSRIMLADETKSFKSPKGTRGSPVLLCIYTNDNVDDIVSKAIAEGATPDHPVENQFYGDRSGSFVDPYGHTWCIGTQVEKLSREEIQARRDALPIGDDDAPRTSGSDASGGNKSAGAGRKE